MDSLETFEVYNEYQILEFFEKYVNGEDRIKLDPIIDSSAHIFKYDLNNPTIFDPEKQTRGQN